MFFLAKILVFTVFLGACSHSTILHSDPSEAAVYSLDLSDQRMSLLGKTPLHLLTEGILAVSVEKNGYSPTRIVLPSGGLTSRSEFTLKLEPLSGKSAEKKAIRDNAVGVSRISQALLELQVFISEQDAAKVSAWIANNGGDFDSLAVYQALVGDHHFLAGRFDESRSAYERALAIDPEQPEAVKMMEILKRREGEQK